ncbi:MAG TPA: hypothetical protein VMC43_00785 [Candidatus Paceibacterota bacterium]|nr:hypothetical protein [Candidatus Paceibacterota bacterium]
MADKEREARLREAMYSRYGVRRDEDLPAALLRSLPDKRLSAQLFERRIKAIRIVSVERRNAIEVALPRTERVAWVASLESVPEIDGFLINILNGRPLEEMTHSVGHELGHTFFTDIFHPNLLRIANAPCRPPISFEEWACDTFSRLWNNRLSEADRFALRTILQYLAGHPRRMYVIEP